MKLTGTHISVCVHSVLGAMPSAELDPWPCYLLPPKTLFPYHVFEEISGVWVTMRVGYEERNHGPWGVGVGFFGDTKKLSSFTKENSSPCG